MAIDTAPETVQAPEEPVEPQEDADATEEAPELPDEPEAAIDDEERVPVLGDPRQAVVRILEKRLERLLQPVDESGDFTGVYVITRRDLGEAFMAPLPPASQSAASVRTPAFIYVDAVCPVCGIAGEISLEISAVLTVEAYSRKLKLKAKASDLPHQCGQQRLRDLVPTRPVKGQTTLDLGDEDEVLGDSDVDESDPGNGVENDDHDPIGSHEDDADLRPTGEVNADEIRLAAANDVREAERSTDGADDDLLPGPIVSRRTRRTVTVPPGEVTYDVDPGPLPF